MNKKVNRFKNQIVLTGIAVVAVVVSMIGGSYAIFSSSSTAGEYNVLKAGNLEVSYVEGENGYGDVLSLNGAYPMSDSDGIKQTPYRFNITNTGDIPLDYRIKIEYDEAIIAEDHCENNLLDQQYVKYQFESTGTATLLSTKAADDYVIYDSAKANEPALQPGSSKIHEIKLWITSDAPNSVLGKHFHGKVVVESIQSGVDMKLTEEYNIGDSVTLVDDSTWHVIKKASKNSAVVTLLKDSNVDTKEFDTENLRLTDNNSYCTDPTHGCNMYENNGSTTITDASIKTWLETTYLDSLKSSITQASGTVEDLTVTLPSMEELVKANKNTSKTFNQSIIEFDEAYLTSTSYWTRTASSINSSYVWYINSANHSSAVEYANNTTIGVRPVIVTSKLNIK